MRRKVFTETGEVALCALVLAGVFVAILIVGVMVNP